MSVNILISSKILTNNLSLKYRDFKKQFSKMENYFKAVLGQIVLDPEQTIFYITLYKPSIL